MAKENIAFLVNLRKNTAEGTDREGRYYPEAESKTALSTKGFAKHVAEHGGLVTYEFMQLVLGTIVKCLKEMMSQGQPVKLDGLGTFRPTETSDKGGAASIEEALNKGVNNMVEGVNFVFIPENAQGEEITSKKFKEQCSLQFAYLVETFRKTVNGKEKSWTVRTPLSAWGLTQAEDEDENGGSENGGSENGGSENQGGSQNQGGTSQGGGQGTINTGSGSQNETVNAPSINGNTSFAESTQVTMSGPEGAEIHYTTDGSTPTSESTLYSEAFSLSETTTVKAIAIKDGVSSEVTSKTFTKSSGGDDSE